MFCASRNRDYCTEIATPKGVCTPPTVACSDTSPVPRPDGTVRLIWYSPAPDKPANVGVTLTLLMRSVTALVVGAAPENNWPDGTAGLVGPNPLAKRATLSPAFAATVA